MRYQAIIFDYRGTLGFKEIPSYVREMIRQLYEAGYLLAIISNSDRYGDARWLRHKLSENGIIEYFQCVIGSAALEAGERSGPGIHKHDPRIFLRVLNLLGVESSETVFVGDSYKHDVLGAAALGMATLHVNVDQNPYDIDLWDLLDDYQTNKRPNRITAFRQIDENTFDCLLRHLTEPLSVGQSVVMGKQEYRVDEFRPDHNKDQIIHAQSDIIVTMKCTSLPLFGGTE